MGWAMVRLARVVVPGLPHHVTQRGNRQQQTFFSEDDYRAYLALMAEWCRRYEVEIWAYCLMPNHVHLIAVPHDEGGLRQALGEAHRRYTRRVNARHGWTGHLWQGRFASFPMDNEHTRAAARYVELNPVRAHLVAKPEDWAWSSAAADLAGRNDGLVKVAPLLDEIGDWQSFLDSGLDQVQHATIRQHERSGRPLGGEALVTRLEETLGRPLQRQKPGPKSRRTWRRS
jgi:putative transposase